MQTSSEICPDSHNFLPNLDKKYCSSRLLLLTLILCLCASQGILGMGDTGHLCCLQTEHLHHYNLCPDQKLCQKSLMDYKYQEECCQATAFLWNFQSNENIYVNQKCCVISRQMDWCLESL